MFGRTWIAVVAVLVLGMGVAVGGDAGGRNINDSNVATLVGGIGDGAASATTVPLFNLNGGITRDPAGNIYYSEDDRILKQTPGGALSNAAGNAGNSGFGGDGGLAVNAFLNFPTILTSDPNGNIFFFDASNFRIRRIGTDGIINTVAGNGQNAGGQIRDIGRLAIDAALPSNIVGIGVNAAGDIFFGASGPNCIFKIAATDGKLTLFAGNGQNAAAAGGTVAFNNPIGGTIRGLALAGDGTVIFSANNAIRQIDAAGNNNVIAGLLNNLTAKNVVAGFGTVFPDDATLPAVQDQSATQTGGVLNPQRIAVDGTTVFFWDSAEGRIRSFTIGGNIQTVFGERGEFPFPTATGFRGNGIPAAPNTPHPTVAPFDPTRFNDDPLANLGNAGGLVASGGVVTFSDVNNLVVRQFTVGGNVTTIGGATDPARLNATGDAFFSQNLSNNAAVAGKGAALSDIDDVACSPAGVFFSAQDWNSGENGIYKYDPAATNITLVAGMQYVNGKLIAPSEGGPASGFEPSFSNLSDIGQFSLLTGGGFLFADQNNPQYVRAVNASGTVSTVGGGFNNVFSFLGDPTVDPLTRVAETPVPTEFGMAPDTGRVGKSALTVTFDNITAVLGSATTDYFAWDFQNLIQVTGGNVALDFNVGVNGQLLAQNGTFLFVADYNSPTITRIDLTVPAAPVNDGAFFTSATGNIRGMATGTRGLYILDTNGNVRLFLPAELAKAAAGFPGVPTAGTNASNLQPNAGSGGFAVSGSTLFFTDVGTDQIRTLTDSGADAADSFGTPATVAGQFTNVNENGFNLQTNFEFNGITPMAVQSDGKILVADDGASQFRLITLGATVGQSTFTVALGTGEEGTGTVDKAATGADNITVDTLAVDSNGIVYFSDTNTFNSGSLVRRVNNGLVETYFGMPTRANLVNPGRNRLQSTAFDVDGLAFNAANELFIAMSSDAVVVKIVNDVVTLVAGQPGISGYSGDGFPGTQARLRSPLDLAINSNNDLYILEANGVRLLTNDNIMTSLFVTEESGFNAPSLAIDAAGKVYIANGPSTNGHIHRFSVTDEPCCDDDLILVAGDFRANGWNGDGLPAIRTLFDSNRMDICFDAALGLLVADTNNYRLRAITNLAETTNTPPIAIIVASPSKQGSVPFKVRFDGGTSFDADGDIVKYAWDFGDGKTLTGRVVEHTYTTFGSFVVSLTVTDSKGQTNTAKTTVFAALPLVGTNTTGKGSFKIAFGSKGANKDSFTIVATNVNGLTDQTGKPAKIFIGSFNTTGTVGGKGVKTTSKTVKLVVDIKKKSVALSLKGVELDAAFAELGVLNENIVGGKAGKTVLVPVVIDINNGGLVVGDSFLFTYSTKFNSGASGKYAQ